MQKLFNYANRYVQQSDWKDLALLKICLCAVGVMLGLSVAKEKKKPVFWVSFSVFMATYMPLLGKFFQVVRQDKKQEDTKVVELRLEGE